MSRNPFSVTKANDLTDLEINSLWVDFQSDGSSTALFDGGKFTSPMPTFILGGKGSGKTHLMRYASYHLQRLRFTQRPCKLVEGLVSDGYVGIYVRCSGLDTGRFKGKGQSDDAWLEIFSYYLELWLGQSLLNIVADIIEYDGLSEVGKQLCVQVRELFDSNPPTSETLQDLCAELRDRRRQLDYEVNNAAFTGKLSPGIALTRGKMIFGLPKLVAALIDDLASIQFCYQLDELENLTEAQQIHVNTLIRERESPATFKIGARQFGIRTHKTLSADEVNVRDSEFDELRLDLRYREDEKRYKILVDRLITRRLEQYSHNASAGAGEGKLQAWFSEPDTSWNSKFFIDLVSGDPPLKRAHFETLRMRFRDSFRLRSMGDPLTTEDVERIIAGLSVEPFPLLEKLNVILFYSEWAKGRDVSEAAKSIRKNCCEFIAGDQSGPYGEKLKRYKSDAIAQLLRENKQKQNYTGLKTFIRMSEGQPRALITLLKHTYDWAQFQGERPFVEGRISHEAQSRGAQSSAEWFYNSMTKAGADGQHILESIERISQLFRINRFSDKVRECSLIGFSASTVNVSSRAQEVLGLAIDRSFLIEIGGGQQDRNSEQVTRKFQLNRMLVPRWSLGTSRRGIIPLTAEEVKAIFDPDSGDEFEKLRRQWAARETAPLFGKRRQRSFPDGEGDADDTSDQTDLFDR